MISFEDESVSEISKQLKEEAPLDKSEILGSQHSFFKAPDGHILVLSIFSKDSDELIS